LLADHEPVKGIEMKNLENYLVGKFVIAPRCSGLNTEEIRILSGANKVELILEPDEIDDENSSELHHFVQTMNIGYEFLTEGCIHKVDIYKVNGTPNSVKLLERESTIFCVEFDEFKSRKFHRSAYIAFIANSIKKRLAYCYPEDPSLTSFFNVEGLTDLVSSAYVDAAKNFDKASSDLIEECLANMKTALAPAW
jgi:hypothetical protein